MYSLSGEQAPSDLHSTRFYEKTSHFGTHLFLRQASIWGAAWCSGPRDPLISVQWRFHSGLEDDDFWGHCPSSKPCSMSPGSSKSPSWRRKRHLSKMDRRRLHFYSRIILTTSAPRILFIWSIVFHSKFWHGQQANFSACTGCSIMSHIATAPQTMQQTSVQKSQDLQNPTATSIKSHCQSLLLRGMAPRSIFSGSPVVYQEAPLQFPFANSPKDFWRKVIQTPQIHNKNEFKKCVLVCVTADDLSMPASPNTVMVSSLGTHLYIWQFFSFQLQVHHELFYKTSTAQSKHWKKMRPLQKVGRANQSSNLASPVTCKCINNDFSGPIKAQEWGFRLAVPPSRMANCDPM